MEDPKRKPPIEYEFPLEDTIEGSKITLSRALIAGAGIVGVAATAAAVAIFAKHLKAAKDEIDGLKKGDFDNE